MKKYSVKIDAFEGPLDLLLHLIQQSEVDIYNISVSAVTAQYLDYVRTMQELQLDVASEYLVMAASLLEIKSSMLLPAPIFAGEEEEDMDYDPREELIYRLSEYKKYKAAAGYLKEHEAEAGTYYTKPFSESWQNYKDMKEDTALPDNVTIYDMIDALQRLQTRVAFNKPSSAVIKPESYSVEEMIGSIESTLASRQGSCLFADFFREADKPKVVVTFLAMLEMMKQQKIICTQNGNFSDIEVHTAGGTMYDQ